MRAYLSSLLSVSCLAIGIVPSLSYLFPWLNLGPVFNDPWPWW